MPNDAVLRTIAELRSSGAKLEDGSMDKIIEEKFKIKTLALFFIDDIHSYRTDEKNGKEPYLKNTFSILATDANANMLAIARKNFPDIHFKQINMIDFCLNKTFDVIICLFSSIGYIKTYANLDKTIKSFSKHLKKGGIVIIEPWFTKNVYITGLPSMTTYDGEDIKISRLCVCKKRGILSVMDMHYLIAKQNKQVTHFVERHEIAMFEMNKILEIMNN